LLVICVQNQQHMHGVFEHGIDVISLARNTEHHVQDVAAVAQLIAGIHEGLTDRLLIGKGCNRLGLGEQPNHVSTFVGLGVVRRERRHHRGPADLRLGARLVIPGAARGNSRVRLCG